MVCPGARLSLANSATMNTDAATTEATISAILKCLQSFEITRHSFC